ncbi:TrbI/VirB10 family protein [Pelagicoccus sp. SDUM812002]|uniref:TrbI/VirB10 family protein n=1 Tax=Pelagicoccus sp. SDUM812002 TaxID=3041266 RepID=UPI00280EDFD5|nr:TrbI/VirB10 family protein [Pelagicoccus sp. SDUM812002]MDQ8184244.1 TrbI/VirB10 family protein [Pelagicoccus sp. SDUM812002]
MFEFIKSPLGNALAMLLLIGIVTLSVLISVIGSDEDPAQFVESSETYNYKPDVYKRDIPRFNTPRKAIDEDTGSQAVDEIEKTPPPKPEQTLSRPLLARQKTRKATKPAILPLNLFSGQADTADGVSEQYAPYGRLVPCQLAITVESNSIDTPIIGIVTEDVVHDGKTIIPAGAEVHGRASQGRKRDRIDATGTWSFVWRTQDPLNGSELTVEGIALDRDFDFNNGTWGMRDGSAGLKGYLIKSDNWNEIRLFASTFLAAATQGVKDYDQFITDTGSSIQLAKNTAGNAALDGTTAVLEAYARQIREAIESDGFYIRIPTGKQFYVYVTQTIDVEKAIRGNARAANIWKQKLDTNEG